MLVERGTRPASMLLLNHELVCHRKKAMKNSQLSYPILLLFSVLTSVGAAAAEDNDNKTGWYLGGNLGQSGNKIDDDRITAGLLSGGITTGGGLATDSIDEHNRSTGGKLFFGFQFNNYLALEAGYFDLGNLGFTAHTTPPGTLVGELKPRGGNLDLVASYPFAENWSGFARAGVTYNHVDADFSATGAVVLLRSHYSDNSADYKYGLGLEYALSDSARLRLEAERYRINDAVNYQENINLISVGLTYRFGGGSASAASNPAPQPHSQAAPLAEQVVLQPEPVAPVHVPPVHVQFSADSFFDLDQASLKPEGEQALQKFIRDLDGVRYEKIQITGHTDRLGTAKHNQDLSLRRAETVKRYLVGQHIDAAKLTTAGVGSAQSMTKPDQCQGNRPTLQLVRCLAPDRRVEIDVNGTK